MSRALGNWPVDLAIQKRRAMSRSRSEAVMAELRERFMVGAQANGVDEATAAEVFRQLAAFSGFGFCKSHLLPLPWWPTRPSTSKPTSPLHSFVLY